MIVFAHRESLDEALTAAQNSVLSGMQVLVLEFESVLKYSATLVAKGQSHCASGPFMRTYALVALRGEHLCRTSAS